MPVVHPVIVGIGQITCRPDEYPETMHPLELAKIAAACAAEDCRCPAVLGRADSVTVINVFSHAYGDPAGLLCEMLGIRPRVREYTAMGGNTPQWLVNRTADRIARGEIAIAILAGAEAMHSAPAGTRDNWLKDPGGLGVPEMVGDTRWGSTPHEMLHHARYPLEVYPLYENALRAARGMSVAENRSFLAEYCARFSKIASENPRAWFRKARSSDEIGTVTDRNRMVNFPYTKYMNPIMNVNQAAAVIMTGSDTARNLGIPQGKWVYLHGGADGTDRWFLSERDDFTSSPVVREVASACLSMAGRQIGEMDLFDLYSCFPSATLLQAREIGLDLERLPPLTITGGLPYFGGPGNSYTLHAVVEAVERLRKTPDRVAFISALGWYFTKFSAGIYSGREPDRSWDRKGQDALQKRLDSGRGPGLDMAPKGAAAVEAYTVMHNRRGEPDYAIVAARLESGERCWAMTEKDPDLFRAMEEEEFVGKKGRMTPGDGGPNLIAF
ncbi:MAG: acetyl-CoA acetyltransferase [Syntrophales bacterium]|nr:acetyl-CoA acetyltransferase [Syntrophales bacterium]